ncbi:myosin-like protein [Phytophthora infestans T30-4]|uniref:Myosin-like protein n=2 Tax=Phytophthora infestans TaxID=4787 RepID=D0MZV2_PHYIT|nr:myosin-like protein [Phytophthora infestans T30-4]EEY65765.1 myosin-like protein [Phytophthora infestans T30-4]KAF4047237.1 Leucine Rich repeat [Phytophthora infestans]KAF4139487.1 Leucine Rich repeat [Phytophthora infestans]|eukprot:XP_002906364.1 myosin-like protein [Phytophthora infestans T30-4]
MALLMPDINLRRAKVHLERYWRQLLGGDRPEELRRLIFRSKAVAKVSQDAQPANVNPVGSVAVAPRIQNLELDPEMEVPIATVKEINRDSHDKRCVETDCGSLSVAQSASCNQKTETEAAGDGKEKDGDQHNELNQVSAVENATTDDNSECNQSATSESADEFLKSGSEQPPSSTSTTGTSSSVSSIFSVSTSDSKSSCAGKPPLSLVRASKDNRPSSSPEKMRQSKYISRIQGPTLGSILQRIHLNDGDVSELDFSTLAQRNKRLEAEGCALVARSLSTNHTVRKLIIRDHAIGDDGAVALSKMLCNNTTLECLDLYGNNIGDRGAEALAQALYGHDSLRRLCLRSNAITDRGTAALAQAIRCNCTLKSLDLVHNRITKAGAHALLDALDVNIHLETLTLDANDVPAFAASQLASALARNRAESLMMESHAAEKQAVKIVRRASGLDTEDEDDSDSGKEENWMEQIWEDDDGDSVSSGFLSCSGVTDVPLSSSGLWI